MAKVKVSIIYVNYNTQDLLEASLRSVVKHVKAFNYEVIVVDNASISFLPSELKKIYSDIKIIRSNTNLGFGGGNNLGSKNATGTYLWLLNTDTLIPKDNNLIEVFDFLDKHPNYAAASPLLVNDEGAYQSSQIAYFPTTLRMVLEKPANLLVRYIPSTKRLLSSINADYLPRESREIDSAAAAAFFVRRDVFEDIGGFSKEYFMYYEDTDLCKKISKAGYKIRFIPDSKVVHLLGQSIKSSYERKKMYFRSQDVYFSHWKPTLSRATAKILRLPLVFVYWLKDKKQ